MACPYRIEGISRPLLTIQTSSHDVAICEVVALSGLSYLTIKNCIVLGIIVCSWFCTLAHCHLGCELFFGPVRTNFGALNKFCVFWDLMDNPNKLWVLLNFYLRLILLTMVLRQIQVHRTALEYCGNIFQYKFVTVGKKKLIQNFKNALRCLFWFVIIVAPSWLGYFVPK